MWGRGSQLGSGEMAKHKPSKFACSTLRLEAPALRKCNTKHAKPPKQGRTDDDVIDAQSPQNRELIESLIGGKTKTGIAKMKQNMQTHPHSRDLPCVGLIRVLFQFLFVGIRAAQSTHSQCSVRLLFIEYIDRTQISELEARKIQSAQ